jgi:hypothetical protein
MKDIKCPRCLATNYTVIKDPFDGHMRKAVKLKTNYPHGRKSTGITKIDCVLCRAY